MAAAGEEGWLDEGVPAPSDPALQMHRRYRTQHGVEVGVGDDVMAWREGVPQSGDVDAEDTEQSDIYRVMDLCEDATGQRWASAWRWLRVGDDAPKTYFTAHRGDVIHKKELFPQLPEEECGNLTKIPLSRVHQRLTIRAASAYPLDLDTDYSGLYANDPPAQQLVNASLGLKGEKPADNPDSHICCWRGFLKSTRNFATFRVWDEDDARPGELFDEDSTVDQARSLAAEWCPQCLLRDRGNFPSIAQDKEGWGELAKAEDEGGSEMGMEAPQDFGPTTLTPEETTRQDNVSAVLDALGLGDEGEELLEDATNSGDAVPPPAAQQPPPPPTARVHPDDVPYAAPHANGGGEGVWGEGEAGAERAPSADGAGEGEEEEEEEAGVHPEPPLARAFPNHELEVMLTDWADAAVPGDLAAMKAIAPLLGVRLPQAVLNPPAAAPGEPSGRKSVSSTPPPLPVPGRGKLGHPQPAQDFADEGGVKAVDLAAVDVTWAARAAPTHRPVPDTYFRLMDTLNAEIETFLQRARAVQANAITPPAAKRVRR